MDFFLQKNPSFISNLALVIFSTKTVVTNLSAVCNPEGTQVTFTWKKPDVSTKVQYLFRLNDKSNDKATCTDGWYCPTTVVPGSTDVSSGYLDTPTFTAKVLPNVAYTWWIHAWDPTSKIRTGGVSSTFTCTPKPNPPKPTLVPPTDLSATCNTAGNQVTFSWKKPTSLASSVQTVFRLNDKSNDLVTCKDGWFCPNTTDISSPALSATTYTADVKPGIDYSWWVQSFDATTNTQSDGASKSITCIAPPVPQTVTVSASPTKISHGGRATISWNASGADSCTYSGPVSDFPVGPAPTSGKVGVGPLTSNSTYTLDCKFGSVTKKGSIVVTVAPKLGGITPTNPTCTLSLSAPTIKQGEPVKITWSSKNATSITLNQGLGALTPVVGGTKNVFPQNTTTYVGTVTNGTASSTCAVTVKVEGKNISKISKPYVNAGDYGMSEQASGSKNAEALQKALSAAGNGRVVIPSGFFCVSKTIKFPNVRGVWLSGTSKSGTTLSTCGVDTPLIEMNNHLQFLTDLSLIGKGAHNDTGSFGATTAVVTVESSCVDCFVINVDIKGGSRAIENKVGEANYFDITAHQQYGSASFYSSGGGWMNYGNLGNAMTVPPTSITAWQPQTTYSAGRVTSLNGFYVLNTKTGVSGVSAPTLRNYDIAITDGTTEWKLLMPASSYGYQVDGKAKENYAHRVAVSGVDRAFGITGGSSSYFRCSNCSSSTLLEPLQLGSGQSYLISNAFRAGSMSSVTNTTQGVNADLSVASPVHDIDKTLVLNAAAYPTGKVVNAADYGLSSKATGAKNAEALQKAVDAAGSGRVVIPTGMHCLDRAINLTTANVWLSGVSLGAALSACGVDTTLISMNGSGQKVTSLNIIGKGTNRDKGTFGASKPTLLVGTSCNGCFGGLLTVAGGSNPVHNAGKNSQFFGIVLNSPYGSGLFYNTGDNTILYRAKLDHIGSGLEPKLPTSGPVTEWRPSVSYSVGQVVILGDYFIIATKAGKSGTTAPTLRNYLIPIADGTVEWLLKSPVGSSQLHMDTGSNGLYGTQIDMTGYTNYGFSMTNSKGGEAPSSFSCLDCIMSQSIGSSINLQSGSGAHIANTFVGKGLSADAFGTYIGSGWQGNLIVQGGFDSNYGGPKGNNVQKLGDSLLRYLPAGSLTLSDTNTEDSAMNANSNLANIYSGVGKILEQVGAVLYKMF